MVRMRTAITANVLHLFSGICEADETYVSGSWKNKAVHIRRQHKVRNVVEEQVNKRFSAYYSVIHSVFEYDWRKIAGVNQPFLISIVGMYG